MRSVFIWHRKNADRIFRAPPKCVPHSWSIHKPMENNAFLQKAWEMAALPQKRKGNAKPIANPCVSAWSRNAEHVLWAPEKCGPRFSGTSKTRSAFLDHAKTYGKTIHSRKRHGKWQRRPKTKENQQKGRPWSALRRNLW